LDRVPDHEISTSVRGRVAIIREHGGWQGGREGCMSVETGNGTDAGLQWGPPLSGTTNLHRRAASLPGRIEGSVEARGPAACLRRDSTFRRSLVAADAIAILGAL